jgi:short-subunit dehydrogenase
MESINELAHVIRQAGKEALAVPSDVSDPEQVEHSARTAVDSFGRIDTWVNNAGITEYATFDKMTEEEFRRIIDVSFMGTVHGTRAALSIMRTQGGGTIINIASIAGKRVLPLQSAYSASKYAIVGFSEALRSELVYTGDKITISTICPPSINTPLFDYALTKEGYIPKPLPPVYDPERVAQVILNCAVDPKREVVITAMGKGLVFLNRIMPGMMDRFFGERGFALQLTREPKSADAPVSLFQALPDTRERGARWTWWGTRDTGGTVF